MAEFKEVMRQYHRMCNHYSYRCCDCPLGKNENLPCEPGDEENNIEEWENTVINWSKNHQPVTVRDLLSYIADCIDSNTCFSVDALLDKEIPEELVEKFNLRVIKGEN